MIIAHFIYVINVNGNKSLYNYKYLLHTPFTHVLINKIINIFLKDSWIHVHGSQQGSVDDVLGVHKVSLKN